MGGACLTYHPVGLGKHSTTSWHRGVWEARSSQSSRNLNVSRAPSSSSMKGTLAALALLLSGELGLQRSESGKEGRGKRAEASCS